MDWLERIRQEKLAAERMRSDPEGFWEEQIEWAKDSESVQDVDRWLWIRGQEVFDEDGEYIDTKEGFSRGANLQLQGRELSTSRND